MNDHWLKDRYKDYSNGHLEGKINEIIWFGGSEEEQEADRMSKELDRREQEMARIQEDTP